MTTRPHLDDRDPLPPREWTETSSAGIRRHVLAQTAAAVRAAKDRTPAEIRNVNEEPT